MKATHTQYDINRGAARMDSILDDAQLLVTLQDQWRDSNIVYGKVYNTKAICLSVNLQYQPISLLSGGQLSAKQFKVYKLLSSEIAAIINSDERVYEVDFSEGSKLSVILKDANTMLDDVIDLAAKISSLSRIISVKCARKGFPTTNVAVAIDSGDMYLTRECVEESGSDSILWFGKPLLDVTKVSSLVLADNPILISAAIYERLTDKYKGFFNLNTIVDMYQATLRNNFLAAWMGDNL